VRKRSQPWNVPFRKNFEPRHRVFGVGNGAVVEDSRAFSLPPADAAKELFRFIFLAPDKGALAISRSQCEIVECPPDEENVAIFIKVYE
jgi:hypothetical protein